MVAGISLAVSLVISIIQCCTCHLCGLGGILDTLFAIVGTGVCVRGGDEKEKSVLCSSDTRRFPCAAWWAAGAGVVTTNVKNGNNTVVEADGVVYGPLPEQTARDFVMVSG